MVQDRLVGFDRLLPLLTAGLKDFVEVFTLHTSCKARFQALQPVAGLWGAKARPQGDLCG